MYIHVRSVSDLRPFIFSLAFFRNSALVTIKVGSQFERIFFQFHAIAVPERPG